MQHRIMRNIIQYNVSPYYTANVWMKHWRAKRGRPFVMARHSLKIIKLWEKEFEVTLSCVRFVSQWYEHYQFNTVLDRSSIISVTKKQHNTGCGTVRTIGLVSLSIVQLSREVSFFLLCRIHLSAVFPGGFSSASEGLLQIRLWHCGGCNTQFQQFIRLHHSCRFVYLWISNYASLNLT